MEEPHNLLLLCEDVRLEIFKYLNKNDMENVSLTCKGGYDVTKPYFEKQTQLVFSKPLSLQELQIFSKTQRRYDEIVVVLRKYDEIIFDQLNYMKIGATCVHLTTEGVSSIRDQVTNLKTKYKTIKKVFVNATDKISTSRDIQKFRDGGIQTCDITSLKIIFEDFDEEFFKNFVHEFPGLRELEVNNQGYNHEDWPMNAINVEQFLKVEKITFHSEISEKLSFLQLFQGITTLIIGDCQDSLFLKTLLELNKSTLKTLQLNLYRPIDYDLVIPCQLHSLTVFAECEHFLEHLISNQNELKHLNLNLAFTPDFLEKLGDHCAPNLNIKMCDYNSYIGTPAEIKPSIPELPVVKHFEVNHTDLPDFLPKTENVETLVIVTRYEDNEDYAFQGFQSLDGLSLQSLRSIDVTNLNESLLTDFSSTKLNLPRLEKIRSKFVLKLFESNPNIRFLEVPFCEFENILTILSVLKKLEELKVSIEIEELQKCLSFFESSKFKDNLKCVEITTRANSDERFNILKEIKTKGDKVFSNYKEHDQVYIVDLIVGIDVKSKQFMYNFIKL